MTDRMTPDERYARFSKSFDKLRASEKRDDLVKRMARKICCPDYLGECSENCSAHYFEATARAVVECVAEEVLEEAAQRAEAFAKGAFKCNRCGDICHTITPAYCTGEAQYRESAEYKERAALSSPYEAMRYFEKRLCRPEEMDTSEAFMAFAAELRTKKGRDNG